MPDSRRRPPRDEAKTYRVKVALEEIEPPIWRRFDIASDLTLDRVHEVLQLVMGWSNYHLNSFISGHDPHDPGAERYLDRGSIDEDLLGVDEARVRLDQVLVEPGERLWYQYDFGDNWFHALDLEEVRTRAPDDPVARCLAGERACPPEDCGGSGGFQGLLDTLAGPPGPERDQMRTWAGEDYDPERFDADQVNGAITERTGLRAPTIDPDSVLGDLLARIHLPHDIGAALDVLAAPTPEVFPIDRAACVRHYSWLLGRIGDEGVKLTSAGYLPPQLVHETGVELELDDLWMRSANREGHTIPVLHFRESAQTLGLLRKANGRLLPTKVGRRARDDAEFLWQHLATALPLGLAGRRPDAEAARQAGALVLLGIAAGVGKDDREQLVVNGLNAFGWRNGDREEMTTHDAHYLMAPTRHVLQYLQVLPLRGEWPPAPEQPVTPIGRAFARAALGV